MSTLHLGVVEMPYADSGGITTGDVAELLEKQYKVFSIFYEVHQKEIAHLMAESYAIAAENVMMGIDVPQNPLGSAAAEIESLFRKFLSEGTPTEFEKSTYGDLFRQVPTKAALKGVSHRFKKKNNGGTRRPSLIDTGLFETNFAAWMEMNNPQ